jgi:SAM-dependent methyltransferase
MSDPAAAADADADADARALFRRAHTAEAYKSGRPTYPPSAFLAIRRYAAEHSVELGTCADIASGSGQAAEGLAGLFGRVIALDASPAQVEEGQKAAALLHPNVEFRVGLAEATGLPDASLDCVCVAEALHWFDEEKFWAEVRRVLRPGGVVAIIGYAGALITNNATAEGVFSRLFREELGPYWHPRKWIVDDLYVGHEPPPPFVDVRRVDGLEIVRQWTVEDAVRNARSWSGYATKLDRDGIAMGSERDPAVILARDLERAAAEGTAAAAAAEGRPPFDVSWPLSVILATKPRE